MMKRPALGMVLRLTAPNAPLGYRLGQTSTQPLQDELAERWTNAQTPETRARIEQDYLAKFSAAASTLDREYEAEKVRQPYPRAGVFSLVVDYADSARKFLENASQVMPQGFPAGPARGLSWDAPASALSERFKTLRDKACATLSQMQAPAGPPVATPRVCPTRPPTEGERALPSGESGGRPRTFIDDALDAVKRFLKKWGAAILVGGGLYVGYRLMEDDGSPRRRRG